MLGHKGEYMTIKTFANLCEQNEDIASYYLLTLLKEEKERLKNKLNRAIELNILVTQILLGLLVMALCTVM